MTTDQELQNALNNFTGTENYYRYYTLRLTDGVKYLAEKANAYWLLDAIYSYQPECMKDEALSYTQFWTLTVNEDNTAVLKCERDTNDVAFTQNIPYTDFPLKRIKLYCLNDVVLLPSEY